jgi:hypothetical protein
LGSGHLPGIMELELGTEAKDKRLNRWIALTVVLLSVFGGLGNIKDGNLVQAMQQAKQDSVDRWAEYQATRTKLHIASTARAQMLVIAGPTPGAAARIEVASLSTDIAHYGREAPRLAHEAQDLAARYDALNVHDDQFDASEAAISTAVSIAAVAALVETPWLLAASWAFGAFGLFMGLCGFLGWAFHPDLLSSWLG